MTGSLWTHLQAAVDVSLVYYFFFLNGTYLVLSLIAFRDIHRHLIRSVYGGYEHLSRSPLTPPISIVVPAYNEEVGIALTVNNLLHLDFMRYEVIVVNDGSTDGTLAKLAEAFRLHRHEAEFPGGLPSRPVRGVYKSLVHHNLTVVDKENGGKADALNAGLNFCAYPYFCSIDADVILEADALQRVVLPIMESDKRVVGVGGIIRVANGCRVEKGRVVDVSLSRNPLAVFQVVEYFRAFLCGRTAFARLNSLMIISGAFGVFERELVAEIGGYDVNTVGEDMDLVMRLHRHLRDRGVSDYSITFVPDPVCWTEVPATPQVLARQRRRWQRGLLETLSANRAVAFNPRYGALGCFGYPFLFVFEGWGVLLELAGYVVFFVAWGLGAIQTDFLLAFFCVAFFCGATLSLIGVLLGEMTPKSYPRAGHWAALVAFALLENLGYRQLTGLLRLWGLADHLRGRGEWGQMERVGLARRP